MGGQIGEFSDSAMLRALLDALESAGVGCSVVVAHPDRLEMAYCNESYARISGRSVAEAMTASVFSSLPPDERTKLTNLRWSIRKGESDAPKTVTTRFAHEDGTIVPVELGLGYALLGEQRATFCFVRDLTEKAKMEAALRESEERFRRLAEASPDSIAIYMGPRCVYANPRALELLGVRDASELETFDPMRLVPPERKDELVEIFARVHRGEKVPPFVTRRTLSNGDVREVESLPTAAQIDGRPASLVYSRDITERQRMQAELMKQDRLASLGVLAAGVAHELNNPLAAVLLMTQRLRARARTRSNPDEDIELDQLEEGVRHLSSIVQDLLFLARPAEQPSAHVDLHRVLSSSISLVRAGMPGSVMITEEIGELPAVHGYPQRLGQVFMNVIRNALQAANEVPNGQVRVRAVASETEIRITVEDTGGGIPEEVMGRLMTPFFTTKVQGTGLGLWISRGIMEAHQGRIDIESSPRGTKVTLVLPV